MLEKLSDLAGAASNSSREPEIARPIGNARANNERLLNVIVNLNGIVVRVCGPHPETREGKDVRPPRLPTLVGALDEINAECRDHIDVLDTLIERLSSQI